MLKRISAAIVSAATLLGAGVVNATPISPHGKNLYGNYDSTPINGVYFVSPQTTEDLTYAANPDGSELITKEGVVLL